MSLLGCSIRLLALFHVKNGQQCFQKVRDGEGSVGGK